MRLARRDRTKDFSEVETWVSVSTGQFLRVGTASKSQVRVPASTVPLLFLSETSWDLSG